MASKCAICQKETFNPLILLLMDFFVKLFSTIDMSVVKCCQEMFNIDLPSDTIKRRSAKLEAACDDIVS